MDSDGNRVPFPVEFDIADTTGSWHVNLWYGTASFNPLPYVFGAVPPGDYLVTTRAGFQPFPIIDTRTFTIVPGQTVSLEFRFPGPCGADLELCGDWCVDTDTDLNHCGACNNPCQDGTCDGGSCLATCPGQTTLCGDVCLDTLTDPLHCGGCGLPCEPGQTCADGTCTTPSACVEPGNPCELDTDCCSEAICCDGFCVPNNTVAPTTLFANCNNHCVPIVNPGAEANCGACGATCSPGTLCVSLGVCCTSDYEFCCYPSDRGECIDSSL